eukprot:5328775-Pyramimonas_sp.AAC.1
MYPGPGTPHFKTPLPQRPPPPERSPWGRRAPFRAIFQAPMGLQGGPRGRKVAAKTDRRGQR